MFAQRFIRSELKTGLTSIVVISPLFEMRVVETSEGQFIGNDSMQIWLEKMDCLSEITLITST